MTGNFQRVLVALVLLLVVFASQAGPQAGLRGDEDPWAIFEAKGARIGSLRIETANVFDLTKKDEHYWLARAANFIHITTREGVIRQALLFKMGDPVNAATIHETERLLRSLPWVQDATIEPVPAGEGAVEARVKIHDGWSLKVGLKFNHAGGQSEWRLRFHEVNFLGLGKDLLLSHEKTIERSWDEIAYRDPMVLGSRWVLEAGYAKLSDGRGRHFKVERPFFQLSTPWSVGAEVSDTQEVETLYDDAQGAYTFTAALTDASLYAHWRYAYSNRTAWRAGVEFRVAQSKYGPLTAVTPVVLPPPELSQRRFRGLFGYWGVSQDRFGTFENVQGIGRTEDVNLGWDAEVHAGYFSKAMGSLANAPAAEFEIRKAWALRGESLLLFSANGHGRKEDEGGRDVLGLAEGSYYCQAWPRQTLAADLQITAGYRLDPENALYVGGFDGLRGYPNHYRTGDRRWLVSAEDRIVTPWRLWGLVQVGFVAFADAGAIRAAGGHYTKTFADAGVGLRMGNLKSTFGRVLVICVAVPLVKEPGVDHYQIVVGNVVRF